MWKVERWNTESPSDEAQMILEPLEISDSGVSSQSAFSELQSEGDKGSCQCFVVVVVYSFNYPGSCTSCIRGGGVCCMVGGKFVPPTIQTPVNFCNFAEL